MISENQIKDTESNALELLSEIKQWDRDEISALQLVFAYIPELHQGEAMGLKGMNNTSVNNREEADLLANYMLIMFGVHSTFESDHQGSYKASIQGRKTLDGLYVPVSPWFTNWYSNLYSIAPSIKSVVQQLDASQQNYPRMLYRGEPKEYPSVRSTLSRHYDTMNATAISKRQERIIFRASQIAGSQSDICANLQHLGGVSNCIDFAVLPWVALYFACRSDPKEDGTIWGFNTNQQTDGIAWRKPIPENDIAKGRIENQTGRVIEPKNGFIERKYLTSVATIPHEIKTDLMKFLGKANISTDTMFPDLLNPALLNNEERIPDLYMTVLSWVEHLESRRFDTVLQESNNLSNAQDNLYRRTGLYFRGLASAFSGDIQQAEKDLLAAAKLFETDEIPKEFQKNIGLIQSAKRSRNASRLNKQLSLEIHEYWFMRSMKFKMLGMY